ncbi:MAG TPA: M67 family metallopeptidase [Acidimicrobiia bacterium]|nr:M67 family metallopeptidase [Acidimicrobiia bacterium]
MGFVSPPLRLTEDQYRTIVAHSYDGLPDEACGLLMGPAVDEEPLGVITEARPCRNEDKSARTYRIDSRDFIAALRTAETRGDALVGCWHSHTHTDAYPSPTDIVQAEAYPTWFYVLVSLRDSEPVLRAYRIRNGTVAESQILLGR